MSTPDSLIKEFNGLGLESRIELVHRLWAEIAAEVPLRPWQQAVVEERIRQADVDGILGEPWEDVRQQLLAEG